MSNKHKILIFFALLAIIFLPKPGNAALDLKLYNSPPCLLTDQNGNCSPSQTTLEGYIQQLYNFALVIGGILAVGMIVAGSIYISVSGSVDKEREGKSFITSALLGLAILFGAYLILKTINPNLTVLTPPSAPSVDLSTIESSQSTTGGIVSTPQSYLTQYPNYCQKTGSTITETSQTDDSEAANVKELASNGVGISSTGQCTDMCTIGCTSVAFLPLPSIQFIEGLQQKIRTADPANCGSYSLTITGGTEVGHQTHRPKSNVFDLRSDSCLINYITNNTSAFDSSVSALCTDISHRNLEYHCNTTEQQPHIHVQL